MLHAHKRTLFFAMIALAVFLADRVTKALVLGMPLGQSVPVISRVFHITYVQNTGAGFGLFKGFGIILTLVTIAVIAFMLYHRKTILENSWLAVACSLILGGALGNLFDRLVYRFVTDFIDFRIWPAFNIADSALTIGAIGLVAYYWRKK